jgi:hypothetical protein
MSGRERSPSLRTLLARIVGLWLHPEPISRLENTTASGADPFIAETVEPVFERLLLEATGGRRDGPIELQPNWTPGERAVFTTRFVVDEFDSTGPLGLLANDVRPLLDEAMAGFRLFGLNEHAEALEKLITAGFNAESSDDDADVLEFAEDWYNLEDADPARAAYIQSHPEEFRP